MEEKILVILGKIQNKMDEMQDQINGMQNQMDDMNERFDRLEELNENLQNEVRQVQAQQFIFEHEYGTKIEAIFDAVTMELDKNLEKSVKIRKLDNRVDRCEANIFGHEKKISSLEFNQ